MVKTLSGVTNLTVADTLKLKKVSANGSLGTAGEVLHSNGSTTYWAADDQGVTSVATGNGMTGGTITTTGTVSVLANTGIVANATGVFVNSAYIATIASNSANYANASISNTFTVGTAAYFVANGNFGIGTASPSTKLHLVGTSGTILIRLDDAVNPRNNYIGVDNYEQVVVAANESNTAGATPYIKFRINASEHVRILPSGNVGIGTSSPSAKLTVNGDILASGDIRSTSAGGNQGNFQASMSGSGAYLHMVRPGYQAWYLASPLNSPDFYISEASGTVADSKMYFKSGGNVGIGNTTPTHKLRVDGTTSLAGAVSDITTLAAGNTSITGFANITTSVNSALLTVGTVFIANATQLTTTVPFSANGGVGSAGQILTSNGATGSPYWATPSVNTAVAYTWTNTNVFQNTVAITGGLTVNSSFTANGSLGSAGQVLVTSGAGNVYWASVSGLSGGVNTAAQFTWTNSHVFQNTVAITGGLIVNSSFTANGSLGSAGQVLVTAGSGNVYWAAVSGLSGGVNTAAQYTWTNTHTFQNTITFSSLVNAAAINVTGTVNAASHTVGSSFTANSTMTNTVSLVVSTNTATIGTAAYHVANGNFGIGTSSPPTKFTVNPKVIDDNFYTYDSNTAYIIHQTPTATATLNDPKPTLLLARQGTSGQAFGAAAEFGLSRYENSSTNSRTRLDIRLAHGDFLGANTTVMTFRSDGSVGIGNTAPTEKLVVAGNIRLASAGYITGGESASGNNEIIAGVDGSGFFFAGGLNRAPNTLPVLIGGTTGYIGFRTLGTEKVRFAANGNVGIGNAVPTHLLSVNGTGYFNANLTINAALIANGGAGSAGEVLHSNGTATYWAADDNTTYDLLTVANTVANEARVRLKDSANANDDVLIIGANGITTFSNSTAGYAYAVGSSTVTVNAAGIHVNPVLSITDLTVSGNLSVLGDTVTLNVASIAIEDSLVEFARNQDDTATFTDALDIGIYGSYGNTANSWSTGLFRDQSDSGVWKIFQSNGIVTNTNINTTNASLYGLAPLRASSFGTTESGYGSATGGAISNATIVAVGNSTANVVAGYGTFNLNNNLVANSTGLYHTGTVNAASHTVGSSFTANSTMTNTVSLVVSTNTATIGTAAYFVSNGNVGIGTASPSEKLHVYGSSSIYLKAQSTTTGTAGLWLENSTGWYKWQMDSTRALSLTDSAGPNRMFVANNGNIGLGDFAVSTPSTAYSPKAKLDVAGSLSVGYALTDTFSAPGNSLVVSGNIGVGTTSPALQSGGTGIHINGTSYSEIKFTNGTTGNLSTDGTALVTNGLAFTINNREAGEMTFGTSNLERMRISAAGYVGIGTVPYYPLQVNEQIRISNATQALDMTPTSLSGSAQLVVGSSTSYLLLQSALSNIVHRANTYHVFENQSGSEWMRITSTGNVGIGNTAPAFKLRVDGTTSLAGAVSDITTLAAGNTSITGFVNATSSVNTAQYTIGTTLIANTLGIYHTGTVNAASHTVGTAFTANSTMTNTVSLVVSTNTATIGTAAYFVSNGNVGIGTATPTGKLHVRLTGDTSEPVLNVIRGNNSGGGAGNDETGINVNIPNSYNNANTIYGLKVYASHNLGGNHYGGYFETAGNAYDKGIALYAKTTHTDTNGPGFQPAILADAYSTVGASNTGYAVAIQANTSNYPKNINLLLSSGYTGADTQTVLSITRNGSAIGSITTNTTAALFNGSLSGSYANITGQVNTATLYATTSANIASAVQANATGVWTTGTVNAASHTVGSSFTANSTMTNTVSLVVSTNTATIGTAAYHVANGNFGIGTSTPGVKLDINGSARIANGSSLYWYNYNSTTNGPSITGTSDSLNIEAGPVGSGRGALNLTGHNNTTLQTDAGYLTLSASQASSAEARIMFNTASSERMRITNTGFVGIGGSSPASKLHVFGGPIDSGGAAGNWVIRAFDLTAMNTNVGGNILFQGYKTAAGATGNFAAIAGLKENNTDNNESGYLALYTTPNATQLITERMRISSAGNVGIGTASPTYKLTVAETVAGTGIRSGITHSDNTSGASHAIMQIQTGGASGGDPHIFFGISGVGSSGWNLGLDNSDSDKFKISGPNGDVGLLGTNDRFTIDATGNVGIGTTSPSSKLEVSVSSNNAVTLQEIARFSRVDSVAVGGTIGRAGLISFYDALNATLTGAVGGIRNNSSNDFNGSLGFYVSNSAAMNSTSVSQLQERMRITSDGDVGIGTSSPLNYAGYTSLTVGSTTSVGLIKLRSSYNSGNGAEIYQTTGGTTYFTTNSASVWMISDSTGKVGIGTTAPSARLQVSGAAQLQSPTPGSGNGGALLLTNTDPYYGWLFGVASNGNVWSQAQRVDGNTTVYNMTLQPSGGNVGIGNVSPAYKLDVTGTAYASSDFRSPIFYDSNNTAYYADPASTSILNGLTVAGQPSFNGVPFSEAIDYDESSYFSLQKHLENNNINCLSAGGGTTLPTFANNNNTTSSFSRIASFSAYYDGISDFIPVQPGERLYGEIYALRETGSTGTAGQLYVGIARYDKDKNPIATNIGLDYFVISGGNVPQNSVWNKYSGYTTLPTSHTVFSGSDGGPVRYVRAYIIVNYNVGTIPTRIGGFTIRKVSAVKDLGDFAVLGNLGVGTTSPTSFGAGYTTVTALGSSAAVFEAKGASASNLRLQADNAFGMVDMNSNHPLLFRTNAAERMRIASDGNVGVGTGSPAARLDVSTASGFASTPSARFWNNNGGGTIQNLSGLQIYGNYSGGFVDSTIVYGNTVNGYLAFGYHNGTSYAEQMRIANTGNVGIGKTPAYKLDVAGSTRVAGYLIGVDGTNAIKYLFTSDGGNSYVSSNLGIGTDSPSAKLSVSDSAAPKMNFLVGSVERAFISYTESTSITRIDSDAILTLCTNNTESARIDSSGNVGIGITAPTAKLTVANGTSATSTHIYGTYTDASNYERFAITANSTGNFLSSEAAGTGTTRDIKIAAGSSSVILTTSGFANFGATKVYGSNWGAGYHDSALTASTFEIANGVDTVWVKLTADAANNMAQRNGTIAQTYRIYGTYTDASNYERLSISASTTADIIRTEAAGTGTPRPLLFGVGGGQQWGLNTSGHLITYGSDNTYDIGTSAGSRPRNVYIAGGLYATTKSFVIDHPTKPNHKLRYGSLESPYHGVRLTGEAEVVDGVCTVKLPDYIHALCKSEGVNVQLTNIKHGKVLWVDEIDIDSNEFTVATETNGNYKFYWSFTAIRKDIEDMVVEFENNEKE